MTVKNDEKLKALGRIGNLIRRIDTLEKNPGFSGDFEKWRRDVRVTIEHLFAGKPKDVQDFEQIGFVFPASVHSRPEGFEAAFRAQLARIKAVLVSMSEEI